MAHWKSMMERKVFDSADLNGRELVVQIESVKGGEVEGRLGGKFGKTKKPVAKLAGFDRTWALNSTNCKAIEKVLGSPHVEKWAGKWLVLYPANVECPEGIVEAIRVRPRLPTEDEIKAARGGKTKKDKPPRDESADEKLVILICEAIEAAETSEAIEAAIQPHRPEVAQMDDRLIATIASARKARLATLGKGAA